MSSILSAQNLQTLRRRNIGRRWPSFPAAAPAAGFPRPPPPPLLLLPKLLRPFIACPPRRCRTDRRDRHRARHADLRPAADPPAVRGRRGGAATSRCGGRASAPPPPAPRPRGRRDGG